MHSLPAAVFTALIVGVAQSQLTRLHPEGTLQPLVQAVGAPEEDELVGRIEGRGLQASVMWGGHPHYPLLLSAE